MLGSLKKQCFEANTWFCTLLTWLLIAGCLLLFHNVDNPYRFAQSLQWFRAFHLSSLQKLTTVGVHNNSNKKGFSGSGLSSQNPGASASLSSSSLSSSSSETLSSSKLHAAYNLTDLIWKVRFSRYADVGDNFELAAKNKTSIHNKALFANITDGDLVWITNSQVCPFVQDILPSTTAYFSIVQTAHLDWVTPLHFDYEKSDCKQLARPFTHLLSSSRVLHYFVENYDGSLTTLSRTYTSLSPKPKKKRKTGKKGQIGARSITNVSISSRASIEGIPIGLPLQQHESLHFAGHRHNSTVQERMISEILTDQIGLYQNRTFKVYVDFEELNYVASEQAMLLRLWKKHMGAEYAHNVHYKTRRSKKSSDSILQMYKEKWQRYENTYRMFAWEELKHVDEQLLTLQKHRINQYEQYRNRAKHVFSLSLFGMGIDCFRTWESLLFGNIVIVHAGPLDEMYVRHGLPVVMVESLDEINADMLQYWYERYKDVVSVNNDKTMNKLTMPYWMNYMRSKTVSSAIDAVSKAKNLDESDRTVRLENLANKVESLERNLDV